MADLLFSSNLTKEEKKIGILVRSIPINDQIGGSEKQAIEFGEHLSYKYNVIIFSRKWDFEDVEYAEKNRLVVRRISFIDIPVLRYFSYIFLALIKIKKEKNNISALFSFGLGPESVISALSKVFFGIPYIVLIRTEDFDPGLFVLKKTIIHFILKRAFYAIVQSRRMKQIFLKEFPNNKTIIIPNGIREANDRASGSKIVYAGRLISNKTQDKGVQYLIDAVSRLNVEGLIVGYGPEEEKLRERSKGLPIEFTGRVEADNMMNYLKQGKIFVLPSLTEGFPNVILEAMSVGLPVIATKVGGIPDIVTHGETGFLIETRNSSQIRKYIEVLLNDNSLYEKMRQNCLREVKKYSWTNVIKKYEKILCELNI